jgi:hypothetical protein
MASEGRRRVDGKGAERVTGIMALSLKEVPD